MRLVETASRWGNLYRYRYWANGKQVTRESFDAMRDLNGFTLGNKKPMEKTSYGFRNVWES